MQLHWHTEPLLLISLLFAGWLYAVLTGPLRPRIAPVGTRYPLAAAIRFYFGLLVVYLAVGSPLDQIAEQFLFSAHMVQHMMLIYGATFLFYFGLPHWLIDLPLRNPVIRNGIRILVHPVAGAAAFVLTYSAWHIPAAYEAALQNRTIHVLEHATMIGTAMMMLWCFVSPSRLIPASSYGVRMVTIFSINVVQMPVFAFLTFSETVLYPTYEWAPRIIPGLNALQDQILGGIIMKVVGMAVGLTLFGHAFFQWYQAENPESRGRMVTSSKGQKPDTPPKNETLQARTHTLP